LDGTAKKAQKSRGAGPPEKAAAGKRKTSVHNIGKGKGLIIKRVNKKKTAMTVSPKTTGNLGRGGNQKKSKEGGSFERPSEWKKSFKKKRNLGEKPRKSFRQEPSMGRVMRGE